MASLSAREAAEQVGLTKQAIIKAIRKGTISAVKDESGEWRIEPAELFRVYQAVATVDDNQQATGHVDGAAGLQREIAFRDEKIGLLQEQIDDLRRRLDDSEAERRQTQERLTALLTDQRPTTRRKWWPWG